MKPESYQHATGYFWKQLDLNQFCPRFPRDTNVGLK